jgi:hypothetical protein
MKIVKGFTSVVQMYMMKFVKKSPLQLTDAYTTVFTVSTMLSHETACFIFPQV